MAIDFGTRRLGIALSDPLGITAQPVTSLERTSREKDVAAIADICREKQVSRIVIGLPRNMDGTPAVHYENVLTFSQILEEALKLPIEHWDERLTTAEAERLLLQNDTSRKKRRKVIDKMAATLILQSWLDARSSKGF